MRQMKDSGIEWIGEIPENWDVHSVKYALSEVKEKNYDGTEKNALKFTNGEIVRKENFNADEDNYVADTILNYTVVNPDTIVINGLNLNYDLKSYRVGIVKERGIITSAYLALLPDEDKICPQYANLLFKGYESTMALHNMGVGLRLTLGYKEFKKQPILVPPLHEQKKIAVFIRDKCTEIDNAIAKTTASIEEYKKLKQAIITKAVTKGIRGNRPMKDSGIEWIGENPADWIITKLGNFVNISSGISVGRVYPAGTKLVEVPYLRVANVQGDYLDLKDVATIKVTPVAAIQYQLKPGELLMTEGGDRDKLGRGCIWNGEIVNCIHQNHVFAVQPNEFMYVEYLNYLTTSDVARTYFDITAKKTTNLACTSKSGIQKFLIPVPTTAEQREIVNYINEKVPLVDNIIGRKQQLITELEAYKKSLIYEYVTGKKEVV